MGFLKEHPIQWIRDQYHTWENVQNIRQHQLDILDREMARLGDPARIKLVLKLISTLNPEQMEAALHSHAADGPILILAGAGSGKTATLTRRVVYLLLQDILPEHILCMTFTNKAANEMRERVHKLLENLLAEAEGGLAYQLEIIRTRISTMWISTFHSCCLRLLKERVNDVVNFERCGLPAYVAIIEPINQKEIVKHILTQMKISYKDLEPDEALAQIGILKNELKNPAMCRDEATTAREKVMADIFQRYQATLKEKQAIDFDDMIQYAAQIMTDFPGVLEFYRGLFQYCLIDEYQDTNLAQYVFSHSLVEKHRRLFAVGDDDQSIYGWRGADIRNIRNFQRDFSDCKIVKMEKNYRSTGNILLAANEIFADKPAEYRKNLKVTKTGATADDRYGERLIMFRARDEQEEAEFVASEIMDLVEKGKRRYGDFAVLYRTNDMRGPFLETFSRHQIPYIEMGNSQNLRQKEIMEFIEFCSIFSDFVPLLTEPDKVGESIKIKLDEKIIRALQLPAFLLGEDDLTMFKVVAIASLDGMPLNYYQVFLDQEVYDRVSGTLSSAGQQKLMHLFALLSDLIQNFNQYTLYGFMETILDRAGFMLAIKTGGESKAREKLVKNLLETAGFMERSMPTDLPTYERLRMFLEDINEKLYGTQTEFSAVEDGVRLCTLHSAKGLEFRNVFFVGLNEDICPLVHPSEQGLGKEEKQARLDEEKRLFYVGVTRAMERLYLTCTHQRTWYGKEQAMTPSRFLALLPKELIEAGESIDGFKDNFKEKTKSFLSKMFE